MVGLPILQFPRQRPAFVLGFFIAGLLISCASSASITWELSASRRRPAFSPIPSVTTKRGSCRMTFELVRRGVNSSPFRPLNRFCGHRSEEVHHVAIGIIEQHG